MINSVSLLGNNISKNQNLVQQNSLLPRSKNLKLNNVDTFSKNKSMEKGPTCGIDCCAI